MRGASKDGSVANYCEIEQIVMSDTHLSSFIQIRGSIPLKWTQYPNLAWDPPIKLHESADLQQHVCQNHLRTELRIYKNISIISLIKHSGSESRLGISWEKALNAINEANVTYHTFDLHKEVGYTKFSALGKLWDQTDPELATHSFFLKSLNTNLLIEEQKGIMRTNCKDNLDRTNLVQHHFAQKVGYEQLVATLSVADKNKISEDDKQEIMKSIRIMWADCGDAISVQYAGTPAMRSDIAKSGKSSIGGAINDATNSLKRYYLNNFEDGEYQDALDIFLLKKPLSPTYEIDSSLQIPRGYNFIQRFLGNIFCAIFSFCKPAHIEGVRVIWGFIWMFLVFVTWTIFRLDPQLIVNRPVLRSNALAFQKSKGDSLKNRL